MSRDQRRSDRRGSDASRSRRTPVRASAARGFPWTPVLVFAGVVAIIALVAYLVVQSGNTSTSSPSDVKAEEDSSTDIPGTFYPQQGRGHLPGGYSPDKTPRPFCPGVPFAGQDVSAQTSATAESSPTVAATATPAAATPAASAASGTGTAGTPAGNATPTVRNDCYNSNPPSSGSHLGVLPNTDIGNGNRVNIPPDPDVYPPDIVLPREAIPHIQEHAGIFVGYHCADGDTACSETVSKLEDLVNDRIDNFGAKGRIVMFNDPDLVEGTIGIASWTRVLNFRYQDYDEGEVKRFFDRNACRFDPEGFC